MEEKEAQKDSDSLIGDDPKRVEDSAAGDSSGKVENHLVDATNGSENSKVKVTTGESVTDKLDSSTEENNENSQDKESQEAPTSVGRTEDADMITNSTLDDLERSQETAASSQTNDEETKESELSQDEDAKKKGEDEEEKNPQFETAPAAEAEASEDHTQALDPFDALLKDVPTTDASTDAPAAVTINDDDDDDDHNADGVDCGVGPDHDDDDVPTPDATLDEPSQELEAPGTDEEVCLLPDTEREISEADKAAAERVLAEKRKLAEEAAESAVPKQESEDSQEDEVTKREDNAEEAAPATTDGNTDDLSQENGDKEADQDADGASADDFTAFDSAAELTETSPSEHICDICNKTTPCTYLYKDGETEKYMCSEDCVKTFSVTLRQVAQKKYVVIETTPMPLTCSECEEKKLCFYYYRYDNENTFYCSMECLHSMMADEQDKYVIKKRKIYVKELPTPKETECVMCAQSKECPYETTRAPDGYIHLCSVACIKKLNEEGGGRYLMLKSKAPHKTKTPQQMPLLKLKVISNATDKYLDEATKVKAKTPAMIQQAKEERERSFLRTCQQCLAPVEPDQQNLVWETMDFCNEACLGRYQNTIGARCANCAGAVNHTSIGKYCVRFGLDIRQFCNSTCLDEFKKGLKICCYCQTDISLGQQGFLAPIGDKGQFKDFCSQACMEKYDQMSKGPVLPSVVAKCAVCSREKNTTIEVELQNDVTQRLCSDPCFAAFKFVNHIVPDQCKWCKKYFERLAGKIFTIYDGNNPFCFCSKVCMNVYISNSRHIVPCNWCKVKKYNFDMIKRNFTSIVMCSLNCLNLYQVSINAVSSRRIKCDKCRRFSLAQYHLTMSDATVRNFCTYQCVMSFQSQYSKHGLPLVSGSTPDAPKAVPTGAPRRTYSAATHKNNASAAKSQNRAGCLPVISNVQSLASPPPLARKPRRPSPPPPAPRAPTPPPPPPEVLNHVLLKTLPPPVVGNKATMTKPMMVSKGVSCRPHPCTKECQTDPSLERRVLIPIPVPIYVPVPCAMWSIPFPVPVPIPLPIPTPVFIPTTRNSAKGIMKEINKIHDKMPTDPYEAELLMMAEMVAGDKKKDQSDSDTDDDNEGSFSPVAGMDGNNAFSDDMLQMAFKMATEYEDQPVDLESAMTANTITPSSHPGMPGLEGEPIHPHLLVLEQRGGPPVRAGRKKMPAPPPRRTGKRRRPDPAPEPEPPREPAEKPDANMCLKYTFGVNAWKQWVMTKNAEIEKSSIRRKPFKSEILQLTADELNYSLCLFVKEVRKPNSSEYAPDTIYYLVLGIQQYLFENGRIDNIFTDPYYEKFTDCLDEVARKFSVLYNDSQYIVTRVEEEHLWESKQLGAHSPHVLLSTLMFFNTKHFNLVTVDEHMQLSFSHIMKHWKRNPNQPGQAKVPGARNVLLRFYPPQAALEANSRKKKVYEQQENEENPLRCPVKLYEFYISKCPESVRTRNDVFYLQPERSCVPDSPVWYSTQPLSRQALAKMLHRVKMVKEINIALLTS